MAKILIREQDLKNLIFNLLSGGNNKDEIQKLLFNRLSPELKSKFDEYVAKQGDVSNDNTSNTTSKLNLNKSSDFSAYKQIANRFIQGRGSNFLGITGDMIANGAKNAFNKYGVFVPVELALAQLAQEGGFSSNPNARPIRTKNPFNIGNVDSGKNRIKRDVKQGINDYFDLMAKKYLTGGKSLNDLLTNFVNSEGKRYASDRNYESSLRKIIDGIKKISNPIYASLNINFDRDLA